MSGFPTHQTGVQKKGSPVKSNQKDMALSGAVSGASAGAALGPWGAVIGGAAGAMYGMYQGQKVDQQLAADKAKAEREIEAGLTAEANRKSAERHAKRQDQARVGVVDFSNIPQTAIAQSTPISSSTSNLSRLYSPATKHGNITKFNMSSKSDIGHMTKSGININY